MLTAMRRISLTKWILIAAAIGVLLGIFFPAFAESLNPLSTIFLRMIKSLVVPLIFSTLVVGIAGHGDDMGKVGRLAFRSIVYFEVVTTFALAIGLIAVNLVRPGEGVVLPATEGAGIAKLATTKVTFGGVLEHVVPQSIFEAGANNEVLQVVFWSILFAVALTRLRGENRQRMLSFCSCWM